MAPAESPDAAASGETIDVEVAYSPRAGEVVQVRLQLPIGTTVAEAVERSGLMERHPAIDLTRQRVGVWGSFCAPGDVLRDRDRVEIYRPLKVDPKEARRQRHRRHLERYPKR